MGQVKCSCSNQAQYTTIPKCSLFYRQLLAKYQLSDGNQESSELQKCNSRQANSLPSQYVDLLLALSSNNKKYNDIYFPRQNWVISGDERKRYEWVRVSELNKLRNNQNLQVKSKFNLIFDFLKKTYPSFYNNIKPIYLEQLGFAVCKFYISGIQTEIIVDDYIPSCFYDPDIDYRIHLLEKAFAKVLGSYKHIDLFSAGQIFTEITGIPYYFAEETRKDKIIKQYNKQWAINEKKSFNSFKDALKCDEILYQTRRFTNDVSVFGYRKDFQLSFISFSAKKDNPSIIRFQMPKKQNISLRISQLNHKFKQSDQFNALEEYPPIFIQLFKFDEQIEFNDSRCHKQVFGTQFRFNNAIYINNIFTDMPAGKYIAYVTSIGQNCKLSLVAYCRSKIKLMEIFQSKIGNNLLQNIAKKQFPRENLIYKEIKDRIFASINYLGDIICVRVEKNYKNKNLYILNDQIFIEHTKNKKNIPLDDIQNKWIFMACIKKQNNDRLTYQPEQFMAIS